MNCGCNGVPDDGFGPIRDLFCAGAIACALYALHRLARGVLLASEVKAFSTFEEAYTPEEREILIHKIKVQSLRY
jgi:hypothetical protein